MMWLFFSRRAIIKNYHPPSAITDSPPLCNIAISPSSNQNIIVQHNKKQSMGAHPSQTTNPFPPLPFTFCKDFPAVEIMVDGNPQFHVIFFTTQSTQKSTKQQAGNQKINVGLLIHAFKTISSFKNVTSIIIVITDLLGAFESCQNMTVLPRCYGIGPHAQQ